MRAEEHCQEPHYLSSENGKEGLANLWSIYLRKQKGRSYCSEEERLYEEPAGCYLCGRLGVSAPYAEAGVAEGQASNVLRVCIASELRPDNECD